MKRNDYRKLTFEDRFYRNFCCGKKNHNSSWANDKKLNRKTYRARLKEQLKKLLRCEKET